MRRLSINIHIEFGKAEPEPPPPPPERESQLDAYVERAHPDDVSQRAELDQRRSVGF